MKKILALALTIGPVLQGQTKLNIDSDKIIVAVLPMTAVALTSTVRPADTQAVSMDAIFENRQSLDAFAEAATQKVVNACVKINRVRVVERSALSAILQEQDFQLGDEIQQSSRIGELLGAQYVLVGQVQQVSVQRVTDDNIDGTPRTAVEFSGLVELNLRLVDVGTGEITAGKSLKGMTGFLYQKTPSEAAMWSLNQAEKEVTQWLRGVFPVEGNIVEVTKEKKGEALEILLSCGKELGVRKEDVFRVVVEREIEVDGRKMKRSEVVGRITIRNLTEDGNFSIAAVDKGGKEIARLLREGARLKAAQTKK